MSYGIAILKGVRLSPQKARLVIDQIRGQSVNEAYRRLLFSPKAAAKVILKVMNSAVANAENEFGADPDDLVVRVATVDQGGRLRRIQPRAKGRANRIYKPLSHITVQVGEE